MKKLGLSLLLLIMLTGCAQHMSAPQISPDVTGKQENLTSGEMTTGKSMEQPEFTGNFLASGEVGNLILPQAQSSSSPQYSSVLTEDQLESLDVVILDEESKHLQDTCDVYAAKYRDANLELTTGDTALCISKGRNGSLMPISHKLIPDQATLQTLPYDRYQDKDYYYLYSDASISGLSSATPRGALPGFKILSELVEQDRDYLLAYSKGYLLVPPYKFPVDGASFQPNPQMKAGEPFPKTVVINGGKQYARYVGQDKRWIYVIAGESRDESQKRVLWYVARKEKKADFKIIKPSQAKVLITSDPEIKLIPIKTLPNKLTDNDQYLSRLFDGISMRYQTGMTYWYYDGYVEGTRKMPLVNLNYELIQNADPSDYIVKISDDNYYYQLIYNKAGDFFTMRRIKKLK